MMLLATTNHVCQDVAVMPFLWVAPLSLYLLSFIICFDHPRWYLAAGIRTCGAGQLGHRDFDRSVDHGRGRHRVQFLRRS